MDDRNIDRKLNLMTTLIAIWFVFLMCAICTGLFLAGRYLGVW